METKMELTNMENKIILIDEKDGQCIIFKKWLSPELVIKVNEWCKSIKTFLYPFEISGRPLKRNRNLYAQGDKGVTHGFGKVKVPINEWSEIMKLVRNLIEEKFGIYTNFCISNHYLDGKQSVAAHSDGELYAKNKFVGTLSTMATRTMKLTSNRGKSSIEFLVEEGDFVIMQGENFQKNWKHEILEDKKILNERFGHTFRSTKI
jgi:alkylated DNA repair dioxygenase AlkB